MAERPHAPAIAYHAGQLVPGSAASFGSSAAQRTGVLDTLSASIGPVPRVPLRDTEVFAPIVRPASDELPVNAAAAGRYQLFGEIARGGMGAVLKGRDPDLGRELAVKVLLESSIAMIRRWFAGSLKRRRSPDNSNTPGLSRSTN